jgi:hypothetical protein
MYIVTLLLNLLKPLLFEVQPVINLQYYLSSVKVPYHGTKDDLCIQHTVARSPCTGRPTSDGSYSA